MQVGGRTVAVTGGGSGIGRRLVLELLARGASVAALDINEAALREKAALASARAARLSTQVIDITDREADEEVPSAVIAAHGQVDGLINCAGVIQPFVLFKNLDYEAMERIMNVNLWGTVSMTKAFLPHVLRRAEAHIVNVSSMGGFLPVPGQTMYGASKAAVKLFTEGLHSELRATTVLVTVVFPGSTATDIAANSGVIPPVDAETAKKATKIRMTTPAAAAHAIIVGMEDNAYRVMAGPDARMMDRLSRLSPQRAAALIYRQMRELLPR